MIRVVQLNMPEIPAGYFCFMGGVYETPDQAEAAAKAAAQEQPGSTFEVWNVQRYTRHRTRAEVISEAIIA